MSLGCLSDVTSSVGRLLDIRQTSVGNVLPVGHLLAENVKEIIHTTSKESHDCESICRASVDRMFVRRPSGVCRMSIGRPLNVHRTSVERLLDVRETSVRWTSVRRPADVRPSSSGRVTGV